MNRRKLKPAVTKTIYTIGAIGLTTAVISMTQQTKIGFIIGAAAVVLSAFVHINEETKNDQQGELQ